MLNAIHKRIIYLLIFSLLAITILYSMGKWNIPFIISLILAYCFHYPSKLISEKFKLSPTVAASIIVFLLIGLFIIIGIFILPLIQNAILVFLRKVSIFINNGSLEELNGIFQSLLSKFGINNMQIDISTGLRQWMSEALSNIPSYIINFIQTGKSIAYIIMFMFMIPIITFYLLKDWKKFTQYLKIIIHKFISDNAINVLENINYQLGAYIKGQLLVCCVLSGMYILGLKIIGINDSLVCGLFSGFVSIASFFGPCLGCFITCAMCLNDLTMSQYILIIILYLIITFLDSNFITPKLIGDKLGIHPFWMMFAICANMSVFGIIGIFLAVPLTVIFVTLIKNIIKKH